MFYPLTIKVTIIKLLLEGCPKHSTENGTKSITIDFSRKIKKCLKEVLKKLHQEKNNSEETFKRHEVSQSFPV